MKIEVKSSTRKVKHADRFGVLGDKITPVVEVWIDGICMHHYCDSPEQARALAIRIARKLGVE